MTIEVGTLKEIGAQVGDVVELVTWGPVWDKNNDFARGKHYTVGEERVDSGTGCFMIGDAHGRDKRWRIISRANQGPVREVTRKFGPSIEAMRLAVSYDPDTGIMLWNHRDDRKKNWNTKFAGKPAFDTTSHDGYKKGRFGDFYLLAHRVAWAIHYGSWPDGELDHINRNPSDNRIANLRDAEPSQNQWNKDKCSNNTSGHKGVTFSTDKGKWVSRIAKHGVTKHLGYFDDPSDAAEAYITASIEMHGEFAFRDAMADSSAT